MVVSVIRASCAAATASAVASNVWLISNDIIKFGFEWDGIILRIFETTLLFWILGFFFSLVLLLPLKPILYITPKITSFFIFVVIGFLVPFSILRWSDINPPLQVLLPPFDSDDQMKRAIPYFAIGMVGSVAALAAWLSLTKQTKLRSNTS